MTNYAYNVGTVPQTVAGQLTWNFNGSLQKLQITDPLNPSNTQTCNYKHDDLSRVGTANCGTIWNQAFNFDPFGNIAKTATVGMSFQPTYDTSKNRMSSTPFTYDGNNGNLTADNSHAYGWDAAGKMISVDSGTSSGVCLTYDALDRMVEQGKGSTCVTSPTSSTEIIYGPSGSKLALMNGTSLSKAFVLLPAGAQAIYTSSGLAYYRHSDWLGSSRLATTPSRTVYYDVAYAPYGEPYAGSGAQDLSFTGQNQDSLSSIVPGGAGGLYDFLNREHTPVQGRWLSPDPAGRGAVNPADPQTWNRYAYVGNRPLNSIDALGLWTLPCFLGGCGGGGGGGGPCDPFFDPFCGGGLPCDFDSPFPCDPGPPGGGGGAGGGGGGGHRNPNPPQRIGGNWPNGETLGLPTGLNINPLGLGGLIGLSPGTQCGDFVACGSLGPFANQFSAGTMTWPTIATIPRVIGWAALRALSVSGLLLMQQGDNVGPCMRDPEHCNQDCFLTGMAKEGHVLQCWYACPRPGGAEVIKWKWATNGQCPQIAKDGDLRSAIKKMNDLNPNQYASAEFDKKQSGLCD